MRLSINSNKSKDSSRAIQACSIATENFICQHFQGTQMSVVPQCICPLDTASGSIYASVPRVVPYMQVYQQFPDGFAGIIITVVRWMASKLE